MIERGCKHIFFGFPSELHMYTIRAYYLHTYRWYRVYESVLQELFSALKIAHAHTVLQCGMARRNFKTDRNIVS